MGKFNPDAYLAKAAPQKKDGFDPDAYLKEAPAKEGMDSGEAALLGAGQQLSFGLSPYVAGGPGGAIGQAIADFQKARREDKSIPNALLEGAKGIPQGFSEGKEQLRQDISQAKEEAPLAYGGGAVAGSLVQAPLTPIKSLGGLLKLSGAQAIGSAIGEGKSLGQSAVDVPLEVGLSTIPYGAGKLASRAGGLIGEVTEQYTKDTTRGLKPNAQQITEAAERLGVKPTTGMLSASPTVQGLESSLEQSPSAMSGYLVRKQTEPVRKALQEGSESVLASKSGLDPYAAGSEVKRGLIQRFGEKLDPVAAQFDDITRETSEIALNPKSLEKISNRIVKIDEARLGGPKYQGIANEYAGVIQNAKSADDLKKIATGIGRRLSSTEDRQEVAVLGKVLNQVRSLENRSIVEAGKEIGGEGLAKGLIKDLKGARKGYREIGKEAEKIGQLFGVKSNKATIPQFLENLDEAQAEQLVKKGFDVNNVEGLKSLKEVFPDQFEVLKNTKLQDIFNKSMDNKQRFSPEMFMRQVKGIKPSAQEMIFGTKDLDKIADIQTLVNSRPDLMGPSGTPRGEAFREMLSPSNNISDFIKYQLYKGGGLSPKAANAVQKGAGLLKKSDKAGEAISRGLIGLQK